MADASVIFNLLAVNDTGPAFSSMTDQMSAVGDAASALSAEMDASTGAVTAAYSMSREQAAANAAALKDWIAQTKELGDAESAAYTEDAQRSKVATDEAKSGVSGVGAAAKLLGVAFAVDQVVEWGKGVVEAGQTAQSTINSTNALLHSMGAQAGVTAGQVSSVADSMGESAGVVGSDFQAALNKALSSSSVNSMFKSGTVSLNQFAQAVSDMSSKTTDGKNTADSLASSSQLLAKAFTDPATGATALKKAGVLLTASQIASIKSTEKQNGVMAAQKELYKDITPMIAGQTAATVPASAKMTAAFKTIEEEIGKKLLPILATMSQDIVNVMNFVSQHSTAFEILAGAIGGVVTALVGMKIIGGIADLWGMLDAAMDANPIGIWVLVAAALIGALVVLYQKSATFRDIVKDIGGVFKTTWDGIKSVFSTVWDFITNHWKLILAILTGPIGIAVGLIIKNFDSIKGVVQDVVNFVEKIWNDTIGKLQLPAVVGKVLSVGGSIVSGIAGMLASGGQVSASGAYIVGEEGPELVYLPQGSNVIPNSGLSAMSSGSGSVGKMVMGSGGGASGALTIQVTGDSSDILVQMLRKQIRLQGGVVQKVLGAAS